MRGPASLAPTFPLFLARLLASSVTWALIVPYVAALTVLLNAVAAVRALAWRVAATATLAVAGGEVAAARFDGALLFLLPSALPLLRSSFRERAYRWYVPMAAVYATIDWLVMAQLQRACAWHRRHVWGLQQRRRHLWALLHALAGTAGLVGLVLVASAPLAPSASQSQQPRP